MSFSSKIIIINTNLLHGRVKEFGKLQISSNHLNKNYNWISIGYYTKDTKTIYYNHKLLFGYSAHIEAKYSDSYSFRFSKPF